MHVILVAADQDLRASITSMLETRGHDVIAFAQAIEGLNRLENDRSIDAFVVVNARDASAGAEICWEARLLSSFERPVYVCLVAPPLSSKDFIEALDCGADDVLQLPISADELYARLRAAERLNQMQHKLAGNGDAGRPHRPLQPPGLLQSRRQALRRAQRALRRYHGGHRSFQDRSTTTTATPPATRRSAPSPNVSRARATSSGGSAARNSPSCSKSPIRRRPGARRNACAA